MWPFTPKLNTVFASRWKALLWAGGVLMTAYCTIPAAEDGAAAPDQAVTAVAAHKSPWAMDKKG